MSKSVKKNLKDALTMGGLCFLVSIITYLDNGELNSYSFFHFNLPTLFIVAAGSFIFDELLKK